MPWIIASQTIPILAIAPMVIVVLAADRHARASCRRRSSPTYLSFFPVTVGMVKGLRSPDPIHLDLMRTYNASRAPGVLEAAPAGLAAVPVRLDEGRRSRRASSARSSAELPTGAVAGIGAQLLTGSYYSQTIQMWSALVAGSVVAALLVTLVGVGGADRAAADGRARMRPSQVLYPMPAIAIVALVLLVRRIRSGRDGLGAFDGRGPAGAGRAGRAVAPAPGSSC